MTAGGGLMILVVSSRCHAGLIMGHCSLALSEFPGVPLVLSTHKCLGNVLATAGLV
jgi:hypothetical protein